MGFERKGPPALYVSLPDGPNAQVAWRFRL